MTADTRERLTILFTVHHWLNPNQGAPGASLNLGHALERLGHSVEFYSFADLPTLLGSRSRELMFPEFTAFALRRAGRRFDVVDTLTGDGWLWAWARRKPSASRPLLVTRSQGLEHVYQESREAEARTNGQTLPLLSRLYHGGLRLGEVAQSLKRADLSLFMNADDLEFAVERLGVSRDRAARTRNGITDDFLGRPLGVAPPDIGIAQVGSYDERKGIRYSVPAFRELLTRYPDVRAGFIGAGRSVAQVLADFPTNLHERVEVVPTYENHELPGLLERFQIKLFPTLAEGCPIVLLEAMACGLVPVTSDTPGPLALVEPDVDALVVPAADAQALARAAGRLVEDGSLLDRLRQAGHAKAQRFGWDDVARETADLYRAALERATPASGSVQ